MRFDNSILFAPFALPQRSHKHASTLQKAYMIHDSHKPPYNETLGAIRAGL